MHVLICTGNTADINVAEDLLNQVSISGSTVLADKACGKWAFREYLADHNADFCIQSTKNETDSCFGDWWLYKERYLVETFFFKLKELRRVTTRFDKLARRFLGFVHLACIRILLA